MIFEYLNIDHSIPNFYPTLLKFAATCMVYPDLSVQIDFILRCILYKVFFPFNMLHVLEVRILQACSTTCLLLLARYIPDPPTIAVTHEMDISNLKYMYLCIIGLLH